MLKEVHTRTHPARLSYDPQLEDELDEEEEELAQDGAAEADQS
jgi:hypothetical protein